MCQIINVLRNKQYCSGDYRDEVTMVVSAMHCWVFLYFVFLFVVSVLGNADLLSRFRRVAAVRTDASANFALF